MPRSRSRSPPARSSRSGRDDRYSGYDDRPSKSSRDYDHRRDSPRSSRRDRYSTRERSSERDNRRNYERRDRDRRSDRDGDRRDRRRDDDRHRDDRPRRREEDNPKRSRSPSGSQSPKPIKPDFGNSGLLAAATNTVKKSDGTATVLKYNEPPEARKPGAGWRLYMFKGKEDLGLLHIAKQSAYLIGRDHLIADIPIDHPSCSKQHAVIQYRQVPEKDEYGISKMVVKPFIIDLESTNGTYVNEAPIPESRYYELKPSDIIKFGQSTREYVLLNEDDA